MKESVPVIIFGQSFNLRSESSPEDVRRVVDFVNKSINEVVATHRVADSLNVALLAFLNIAHAYLHLQDERQGVERESLDRLNLLLQKIDDKTGTSPKIKKI